MSAQDREKFNALKLRNKELEIKFEGINEVLLQYKANEAAADQKIKALNSIHSDKIRSLMNSVQLLKKENKQLEKLSKEHKRSELISQLQKDVSDQDTIIETIRNVCKIRNIGEETLDSAIMDALTKGPPRIRAATREELKMDIKKLKGQVDALKKNGTGKSAAGTNQANKDEEENEGDEENVDPNNQSVSMQASQVQEAADSNNNLIRRLEELKNENDELRLNLKAETQIVEKYEDQLLQKSDELNTLRSAKTDYIILTRKYETLQLELEKIKSENHAKFMHTYDKELKLEEMEIVARTQQDKIKMQEENLQLEMDSMAAKLEDVIQRLDQTQREHESVKSKYNALFERNKAEELKNKELNAKFTTLTSEHSKLSQKYQMETTSMKKTIDQIESKLLKQTDENTALMSKIETQSDLINTLSLQIDDYKDKIVSGQGMKFEGQSWAMGRGGEDLPQETKNLREKIRVLINREIQLQEELDELRDNKRLKEQRELATSLLHKKDNASKKGISGIELEKLKKDFINETRQEYESKLTTLRLRVKELQDRNQQLTDLRSLLGGKSVSKPVDISSIGSYGRDKDGDILSENSGISEVKEIEERIAEGENRELKKKLQDMVRREAELRKQMELYSESSNKRPASAAQDLQDKKLKEMQAGYSKEIKNLRNTILQLELKNLNLSLVKSDLSDLLDSADRNVDEEKLANISSNIHLSLSDLPEYTNANQEKQRKERQQNTIEFLNISEVSSDVNEIVSRVYQKKDFDDMSSGISNISMKKKPYQSGSQTAAASKLPSTNNNIFSKNTNVLKNGPRFEKMNSDIESILGGASKNQNLDSLSISSGISAISRDARVPINSWKATGQKGKDAHGKDNSSINSSISNIIHQNKNNKNKLPSLSSDKFDQNLDDMSSNIDDILD